MSDFDVYLQVLGDVRDFSQWTDLLCSVSGTLFSTPLPGEWGNCGK